jgi:hypothetical protein
MPETKLTWLLLAGFGVVVLLVFVAVAEQLLRSGGGLRKRLKAAGFRVLSNVRLPNWGAGTKQVDHVVATAAGIVCIELRDDGGIIEGALEDRMWTHRSRWSEFRFVNPVLQQRRYLERLRRIGLGVPVHGIVVFPDAAEFAGGVPNGVCHQRDLEETLRPYCLAEGDETTAEQALRTLQRRLRARGSAESDALRRKDEAPQTQS